MQGPGDHDHARLAAYRGLIFGYLRRRVRDVHAAEDLTQETLLRGLVYSRSLRRPVAIGAWLTRIAFHVVTDWHRRARRSTEPDGPPQEVELPSVLNDAGPDELAERARRNDDLRHELRRALRTLGRLDRILVVGRYYVGLDCAELARRSGLSHANVRVRLSRARRLLRAQLQQNADLGRARESSARGMRAAG